MEIVIYEDGQPVTLTIKEKIKVRDLEKAGLLATAGPDPTTDQRTLAANLEALVVKVDGIPGSYTMDRFMDCMDIESLSTVGEAIIATFQSINKGKPGRKDDNMV